MSAQNICPHCANSIPEDFKFCAACGNKNSKYVELTASSKMEPLPNPIQVRKFKIPWGVVGFGIVVVIIIIVAANSNSSSSTGGSSQGSGSFSSSQSSSAASSNTASTPDTSWKPVGFYGTVKGDANIVWKATNTSGDSAYDKQWCVAFGPGMCFFYRVAVNEDCSSISGTLQLLNSLGEVEDSVQAASPASVLKGGTTTLNFEPTYNWKGKVKLVGLGCTP